jgi:hypothetical protein
MIARVTIEQITSDKHSYRYGKVLHLAFMPSQDASHFLMKVSGLELKSTDLQVQRHAKLLRTWRGFSKEHGAFNLSLGGDTHADIVITEQAYDELSLAIKENLPPSDEELAAERKAAFMAQFPSKE